MQSSAMTAIRGLIMLATLIVVPATALFCKSVPSVIDRLIAACESRFGFSLLDGQFKEPKSGPVEALELGDAPRFEPSPQEMAAAAPAVGAPPTVKHAVGGEPVNPFANEGRTAIHEAPITSSSRPAKDFGEPARIAEAPGARPLGEAGQQGAGDFGSIQARLRQLGATYYLLESWGTDGSTYRFHCKMALAGSDRYCRNFEATAAEPIAAMESVLRQVEQWRAGR